eukprot:6183454-Pleurochrysis_carterae.AAC.5
MADRSRAPLHRRIVQRPNSSTFSRTDQEACASEGTFDLSRRREFGHPGESSRKPRSGKRALAGMYKLAESSRKSRPMSIRRALV